MNTIQCKSGYYYLDKEFLTFEEAWSDLKKFIETKHKGDKIIFDQTTGKISVELNIENNELRFKAPCLEK